jgi:O-acetylhomoserine/O-acetylserine sulfhydrylase-like pyridoxal-dependent enzyme
MSETWEFETLSAHAGYAPDPTTKAVAVPIYQTAAYAFDSAQHGADLFDLNMPGNIFSRIMNSTQDLLEKRVAALEGNIAAMAVASDLVSIGNAKSLATHPASTTHRQFSPAELIKAGVPEDAVRLSIGIEHVDDLLADLQQALDAV